jgi:hypothetical protein
MCANIGRASFSHLRQIDLGFLYHCSMFAGTGEAPDEEMISLGSPARFGGGCRMKQKPKPPAGLFTNTLTITPSIQLPSN